MYLYSNRSWATTNHSARSIHIIVWLRLIRMSTFSVVCRHFILSFVAVLRPRRVSQFYIIFHKRCHTSEWKLKCSWFLKLFCNYGAAIHDICMYDVPMSIRLAKNYLNCQHVISLQSRPAPRIWIETFPSSPSSSKIYDISVTGQWRHRKWARDLISFLTHHSQGFQKCPYM